MKGKETTSHSKIIEDIKRLDGFMSGREKKYQRAYNRYFSNGPVVDSIGNIRCMPPGAEPERTEYGVKTKLNVQTSIIDTICSKLSQLKVRPFFNPVDGSFDTSKACDQAQLFFDHYYSFKHIPNKIALSTRDAATYDVGEIWVDEKEIEVKHVSPWTVFLDPAEFETGTLSRVCLNFKNYPIINIIKSIETYGSGDEEIGDLLERLRDEWERDRTITHDYTIYYDLYKKRRFDIFGKDFFYSKELSTDQCPLIFLFYKKPMKGFFSVSVIDETYGLQVQIDEMGDRIDAATRTAPFATILYPESPIADIEMSKLSNEPFQKVKYHPVVGGGVPQVITPSPISPAYQGVIDSNEAKMYQIVGVSQLSAQSKKPGGVTSGVALQTLEDVESDRFNTLVNSVIECYVEIAKTMINCFPEDADILPKTQIRKDSVKWKDLKREIGLFTIQFSASSSLSKDPATKLEQINQLVNGGFIAKDTAAKFLEMPDLERAFAESTAVVDYADYLVERAIEKGEFDFLEVINLDFLFQKVVTAICRVAPTGDEKAIENLKAFLKEIDKKQKELIKPLPPEGSEGELTSYDIPEGGVDENLPPPPPVEGIENPVEGFQG